MLLEINNDIAAEVLAKGKRTKSISGLKIFNPKGWKYLKEHVGELTMNQYHHFVTEGYWSSIHLLVYLVEQCGVSDVWLSSWSISENAISRLVRLKQNDKVKSYTALFDRRVELYTNSAYHFAMQHMDITLMPIHAKVIVIKGEKLNLVVSQSANLNDNKRVESGIISTHLEDVEFYIDWIEKLKATHGK